MGRVRSTILALCAGAAVGILGAYTRSGSATLPADPRGGQPAASESSLAFLAAFVQQRVAGTLQPSAPATPPAAAGSTGAAAAAAAGAAGAGAGSAEGAEGEQAETEAAASPREAPALPAEAAALAVAPKSVAEVEAQAVAKSEADVEAEAEAKSEVGTRAAPGSEAEAGSGSESGSGPGSEAESGSEAEAEAAVEAGAEVEDEAQDESEPEAESEAEAEVSRPSGRGRDGPRGGGDDAGGAGGGAGGGAAARRCRRVTFLRIPKTGSSSLDELRRILCERSGQVCERKTEHKDYRRAFNQSEAGTRGASGGAGGRGGSCVFTMLRDPVDRLFSEYFFLRQEVRRARKPHWNYGTEDIPLLMRIMKDRNLTRSFLDYLHFPGSPAKNRQALYLLGFQYGRPYYAGRVYDWSTRPKDLLNKAMAHLADLSAFGITDCFRRSVKAMAPRLGWDAAAALDLAEELNTKRQAKDRAELFHLRASPAFGQRWWAEHRGSASTGPGEGGGGEGGGWRPRRRKGWKSLVDPALVAEILEVNRVDAELLQLARARFHELYGVECPAVRASTAPPRAPPPSGGHA